jgi:signal peptide peptidase SppA
MNKFYSILAIMEGRGGDFFEMEAKAMAAMSSGQAEPDSDLLSFYEGAAIIEVKGQLTNRDSYFNSWFGLISYNQIRAAAVEAIEMGAGAILFDIDSPGGTVSGMKDLSTFIEGLDVPTLSHTSGTMASAAYFTGISCENCYADDMSEVGSVGVVMTAVEYTKAMEKAGYTAEVFRSGKHKQAGNPNEKLSAENKKYLQGQVLTYANKFYDFVSEHQGIPRPAMAEIETGKTFIGEEAFAAGLVDKIISFDEALALAINLAEKTLDNQGANSDYYKNGHTFNSSSTEQGDQTMAKKFSKKGLAALVTAAKTGEKPLVTGEEQPAKTGEGAVPVAGAEGADPNGEGAAPAAGAEGEDAGAEALGEVTAELTEMTDKYDASQVELADATSKLEASEAQVESDKDAHATELSKFGKIIIAQINTMRTALSLTSVDMSGWGADAVLTEHGSITKTFESSLPVGGIVPDEGADEETKVETRSDKGDIDALGF